MKAYLVLIGRRGTPRLSFETMARSSCECVMQHMGLCEPGERLEVRAL